MHARASIKPGSTIAEAVPRAVDKLVHDVVSHEDAARRGVVEEGIHDLRVATKRLREATRVFGPALPKRRRAKRLSRLRGLNDALGAVRDADVALATLGRSRSKAAERVARGVRRERTRAQAHLVEELERFASHHEAKKLRRLGASAGHGASLPKDATVESLARERLAARLERLEATAAETLSLPNAIALHALRIAVKKARYALEPFRSLLPPRLVATLGELEDLQGVLGDLHDAELLSARVLREVARARAHERRALVAYMSSIDAKRHAAVVPVLAHLDHLVRSHSLGVARETAASIGAGARRNA